MRTAASSFLLALRLASTSADVTISTASAIYEQSPTSPYVCVTMDWWPSNKCDSPDETSDCAWANASILSAPLDSPRLISALQGLGSVTLRLGGSLADGVVYDVGRDEGVVECKDFETSPAGDATSRMFRAGCLSSSRWLDVLSFAFDGNEGVDVLFGLNAMRGRECTNVDPTHCPCFNPESHCSDSYDSSNAEQLVRFTAASGYRIAGYELGNELACLSAGSYAAAVRSISDILRTAAEDFSLPAVATLHATDYSGYNQTFLDEFIPLAEPYLKSLNWHNYPLGAGVGCSGPTNPENNTDIDKRIMSASGMDSFFDKADAVISTLSFHGSKLAAWVGEMGGAYNSGCLGSTNSFMSAFWYLPSLGGSAARRHDKFCRQTFIGGNYEIVDKTTLEPNPDYYAAKLFGGLMGKRVLQTDSYSSSVNAYAHCAADGKGVALLLLNYGETSVSMPSIKTLDGGELPVNPREEYVLTGVEIETAADALHSNVVALNGVTLRMVDDKLPSVKPKIVSEGNIVLPPTSYGFFVFPNWNIDACK